MERLDPADAPYTMSSPFTTTPKDKIISVLSSKKTIRLTITAPDECVSRKRSDSEKIAIDTRNKI